MSEQVKTELLTSLREEYMMFMNRVLKIPGAPMAKQQAFLRFDEGHMWMQNAIVSFVEPEQAAAPVPAPVPQPEPIPEPLKCEQDEVAA
jgi:hypothetical protein